MTKSKLSILLDSIFISVVSFLIFFFWAKRYIKSLFFVYFLPIFLSLILYFCVALYFSKKYKLSKLNFSKSKKMDFYLNYFKMTPMTNIDDYLKNLFSCKKIDTYIFENKNYIFYINFRKTLSENDYFDFFDKFNISSKNYVFISQTQDEKFLLLAKNNQNIFCFNFLDFYKFIDQTNNFPTEYKSEKHSLKQKYNFSIIKVNFSKQNFKKFFFSGLSLLLFSFFIPFSFYYAVIGTIFFVLSFFCLINKLPEPIKNSKTDLQLEMLANKKEL